MRQLEDCVWVISKKNFETIYKDATLKMVEKSNEKGLNCKYLFFPHFKFDEKGQLFYDEQKIDIAPKIAYIRGYDLELIKWLEKNGTYTINSLEAIENCRDKIRFHQLIEKTEIKGLNKIKYIKYNDQSYDEIAKLLGKPFIMKDATGSGGSGVFLASNEGDMEKFKKESKGKILCQEYITTSKGRDVRFVLVGNKVIGVYERINDSDWRSNLALGGHIEIYNPTQEQIKTAEQVSEVLGAELCAVDFMFGKEGELLLCEANSNPALLDFYLPSIKMVDSIFDFIKEKLKNLEKQNDNLLTK